MEKYWKKVIALLVLILVITGAFFFVRWIANKNTEKSEKKPNDRPDIPPSLPPSENKLWWLTDEEINYAYQEIEKELGNSSEIKLVSPSVVRVIQEGGEISEDLKQAKIIFFPINNSENHETADSGSHWTLLVCDNRGGMGCFAHYNSAGLAISANATKLAEKLCEVIGIAEAFQPLKIANDYECPQQTNGSDCGVYVIAFTRHLANEFHKKTGKYKLSFKEADLIFSIDQERAKLQVAGFPKNDPNGGNYDIGDDVDYRESEEELISQWWPKRENPHHPMRLQVRTIWFLDIGETGELYENADKFKEFSKKVRKLSGKGKIERSKLFKIYRIKKILKACSLPLEEYKKTESFAGEGNFSGNGITEKESKFIKANINKETVKEINDLYNIYFPGG